MKRRVRLVLLLTACGTAVLGGSWDDLKRSCFERANLSKGKYFLEECAEQVFTLEPVHPTVNTIAPGTGIAFGLAAGQPFRTDRFEFLPSATLLGSSDHSYLAAGQFVIAAPPISLATVWRRSAGGGQRHGVRTVALIDDSAGVDAKASLALRVKRLEAADQAFYGIGAATARAGESWFALRRMEVGLGLEDPLTFWSSIGVTADYVQPRTGSSPNTAPGIATLYSGITAPGLGLRHNFTRIEPHVQFRLPVRGSDYTSFKVGYAFYDDLDGAEYSFHRLSAIATGNYVLKLPSHQSPRERSGFASFICPSLRSREHCSPGDLTLTGVADISYTGKGAQVPFFFDETLGGTDFYGNDTLRGFADYRFRGPSRVLFQAEYRHGIWGPVGFLAFYDTGKVGVLPSDMELTHLRHDEGVGLFFRAANTVVLRAYIGFGSGEGVRPNYKLPTVN